MDAGLGGGQGGALCRDAAALSSHVHPIARGCCTCLPVSCMQLVWWNGRNHSTNEVGLAEGGLGSLNCASSYALAESCCFLLDKAYADP